MTDRLIRLLNAPDPPIGVRLARLTLAAAAHVHHAVLLAWMLPFAAGVRRRRRLMRPVVSVGNLASGGTGKTPFTILLCRIAQRLGAKPVVLIRGYRGRLENNCGIVSDGERVLLSPAEAGDEAVLIARELPGVPVLVGRDRRKTGGLAIRRFDPDLLVLDDGMQFLQLQRDLDIALADAARPFDNGWMLPRGLLREPPSHLRRANAVVLTGSRAGDVSGQAKADGRIRDIAPNAAIMHAEAVATGLRRLNGGPDADVSALSGRKAALISGIAHPERFHALAESLGLEAVLVERVADHDLISPDRWQQVCSKAMRAGAQMVITTAKDAVKSPQLPSEPPIYSLDIRLHLQEELELTRMLQDLLPACAEPGSCTAQPTVVGEAR